MWSPGVTRAASAQPTTLSTALWRPTSSRTTTRSPLTVNSAAACSPPVSANSCCAERSRSGNAASTVRGTAVSTVISRARRSRSAIATRPHTPHAAEASNPRPANALAATSISTASSSACAIDPAATDSACNNPRTSSRSAPGVRMIVATGTPRARSCRGASTITRSRSRCRLVPSTRSITTSRTGDGGIFVNRTREPDRSKNEWLRGDGGILVNRPSARMPR